MPNNINYEYAVIRLVPKVEREEFMNVGVLLYARQGRFLGMKYQLHEDKIKAFAPDLDVRLINSYLSAWEEICQGAPKGGKIGELEVAMRYRWLASCRSTMIQSSETHPGLCADPQEELNQLFHRFVL